MTFFDIQQYKEQQPKTLAQKRRAVGNREFTDSILYEIDVLVSYSGRVTNSHLFDLRDETGVKLAALREWLKALNYNVEDPE